MSHVATNPFHHYAAEAARLAREGRALPLGGLAPAPRPTVAADAPRVLLFAPHPDDECIIGALPLRLLREARMRVIDVAVTLGSNKQRQQPRLQELMNACAYVGFELLTTAPDGLEGINVKTREGDAGRWRAAVEVVAELLRRERPRVVFFPHQADWNSTHIGTHFLVMDALARQGKDFACHVVETEYWAPLATPNLMVESTVDDVADLMAGTGFHVGEVQRNPYHLGLPAWMQDNVRRGGELVGGQGGAAPDFTFATLYRARRWADGKLEEPYRGGRVLSASDDPGALFAA
jgi:LmbE family N-acetylglucosaminyl deacetylase